MQIQQLAINSVTTRHAGLEEALSAYAEAGFRQVEFVLPHVKDWLAGGHTAADVRALLDGYGLRPIGGFQAGLECFSAAESQAANHALQRENAQLIHDLGGGTLVVGTDGPGDPPGKTLNGLEVVAETLGGFLRSIDGLDVTVAIEFNWGPMVKSFQSAVRVCELVNHPRAGVLFDPAHYHCTPTKLEHLTPEEARWITHVHLDDMRPIPGDLSDCNADRVLPGEGIIPLPDLIAAIEAGGYTGPFSIEMFNADLWVMPADRAAKLCYESLLPLCSG